LGSTSFLPDDVDDDDDDDDVLHQLEEIAIAASS